MAAKNTAVSARYHEVISHMITPCSPITWLAERLYPMLISISRKASGINVGDNVSPLKAKTMMVSSEISSYGLGSMNTIALLAPVNHSNRMRSRSIAMLRPDAALVDAGAECDAIVNRRSRP